MTITSPKIALCANGIRGFELAQLVFSFKYPVELVGTWSKDTSEYEERISDLCKSEGVHCLRQVSANSKEFASELEKVNIDIVLLLWWPEIIEARSIRAAKIGWINQHTGYLPYNQGMHPWYWTIIDGNKFGVTLHFINDKVDAGDILFQSEIAVDITDTGETLYRKLIEHLFALYRESFPKIVRLEFNPIPQPIKDATFHRKRELDEHSRIDLERQYKAGDLINIIRARTFWDGPSAYFFKDGKKYYIRIDI